MAKKILKSDVNSPQEMRNYKDTVFRMLFSDKKRLLSLYNAVNGTRYDNPDDLEIVTLENAIYMNVKNDLAFLIDLQLYLYEHQSTVNPNMPLRFLQYVAKEYEKLTAMESLYGRSLIQIPAPKFVVFYNGVDEQPERRDLRLSDAFTYLSGEPKLELLVEVLNINVGYNLALMEQCRTLKEYMQYVNCVRKEAADKSLKEAVSIAVDKCIEQGIMSEFLLSNKAEVISMSIFEYDEEKTKKAWRQDGFEDGFNKGESEGEQRAFKLIKKMSESGEGEQIPKLSEDANFLQKMYEKYGI